MTETALAATTARPMRPTASSPDAALDAVSREQWSALLDTAIEPNVFFDPGFALPAAQFAHGGVDARALSAVAGGELIGLLPVTSAWQSYRLPIPTLVSSQPYTVLGTPLLSSRMGDEAAAQLLDAAAALGAHLLSLHMVDLDGPALAALRRVAERRGLFVAVHRQHQRAALAVPEDAEAYLRAGMGSKKLKELRRLRNRLDEDGAVDFRSHTSPEAVKGAVERFLRLEAKGWKGQQGTGLGQDAGDARFVIEAATQLAATGSFEALELTLDGEPIASGLILRQRHTALFFKITYDEAHARYSPGVQLTVELTRRFAEDPAIRFVDSSALPGHPMIDHVWRERRSIGNVLIATRRGPTATICVRLIVQRDRARETAKHILHKTRSALKPREKSR